MLLLPTVPERKNPLRHQTSPQQHNRTYLTCSPPDYHRRRRRHRRCRHQRTEEETKASMVYLTSTPPPSRKALLLRLHLRAIYTYLYYHRAPLSTLSSEDAGGEGAGESMEEEMRSPRKRPVSTVAWGERRFWLVASVRALVMR